MEPFHLRVYLYQFKLICAVLLLLCLFNNISMQVANRVLTCFRSVEKLIGAEYAGTSGSHHAYFDRTVAVTSWSSKMAPWKPHSDSFSSPACLLLSSKCLHTRAAGQQLLHKACSNPATSSNLRSLLLNIQKCTSRQQHSFRTQASVKSLWQRGYDTPGFSYRRSYSIWDCDNVLYGLIAANLAGFLLWQSYPGLMYRHATVSVNSVREGRVYTLLTSAFSHNAFSHILANMVTFYFFGRSMSHILGGKKVCLVSKSSAVQACCSIASHLAIRSCTAAATVVCGWRTCWQSGACDTVLPPSPVHR